MRSQPTRSTASGPIRRAWVFVLLLAPALLAQESSDCLACHAERDFVVQRDGRAVSMFFDEERAARSAHAATDCVDCHVDLAGVTDYPHARRLKPADCSGCHDDSFESIAAYWNSSHGRAVRGEVADAPRCGDCHGSHYILRRTDPASSAHVLNVPRMCTQCHTDGNAIQRLHEPTRDQVAGRYKDHIHGRGLFRHGLTVAPVCTTCHSAHGVLPPDDPASPIHRDRVNEGCARCHNSKEEIHRGIVAEHLWQQPGVVPLCVDCHQPHSERRVSYGTNMSDGECLACHDRSGPADNPGRSSKTVDHAAYRLSVHGRRLIACAQCHSGAAPSPDGRSCGTARPVVDCSICHDAEVRDYRRGIHGSLHEKGDANAPACVDCHGTHDIMESRLPQRDGLTAAIRERILAAPTHRRNVPALCARCHQEGAPAAVRNPAGEHRKVEHYRMSIHGKGLLQSGLIASANCVDCHSPHMELPPGDPASTVAPDNIVATCGQCHDGIYEQFRHSIHAPEGNPRFRPAGDLDLPHCNDCHSSHSVARTDLPGFKHQIVEQCGACHQRITATYFDTYHGKVSTLGNDVAARCHDCHGSHGIRPASDPASPIHPDNIVATCARCHPGSHAGFASYLTHATHNDRERYPALYWSFLGMTALLVGVFGFFGLHLLLWLPRSLSLRRQHRSMHPPATGAQDKVYRRFSRLNRNLHRTVIVTFLGLTLTGMVLKFSETAWAQFLTRLMGGTATAGWVHRICAIVTFGYMAVHLVDVVRRLRASGRSLRGFLLGPDTMVPTWRDVRDFFGTIRWFLGRGPRPRYGKWTYWEKFDYFAVFWGVIVIGGSGLILWFPELATRVLPGWSINVATIIHSEEALLAAGFIFTIHFFNTHLRPEKFPMDTVVFTGTMPLAELKAERPELYDELMARGELDAYLVDPPTPRSRRAAYIFGTTALVIGIITIVLIIHGLLTVGL